MAAMGPAGAHTSALFPTNYDLRLVNQTRSPTDIVVYQVDPAFSAAAVPLVWQDTRLNAGAQTALSWSPDYSVSWSDSANLKPGALYRPVQTLSVSPGAPGEDGVDLTDAHGVLGMHRVSPPSQSKGTLSLEELNKIPASDASVAIGMAGRPASAVIAQANQSLRFTPHPNYWITEGTFTEGEVINPQTVSNPMRLHFGTKGELTVTLHAGGRWTIS
jgi:hypothetical protein